MVILASHRDLRMTDTFDTYEKKDFTKHPRNYREYFRCECGRELLAEMTECDRCGAWYLLDGDEMEQVAPPIEGIIDDVGE